MFSSDAKARHDRMVRLVETMLRLHKNLPKAKTPHEQESLQRQIGRMPLGKGRNEYRGACLGVCRRTSAARNEMAIPLSNSYGYPTLP